jgi:hypothetical protein
MCFEVASTWFPEESDVYYKAILYYKFISLVVTSKWIYFLSEFGLIAPAKAWGFLLLEKASGKEITSVL